MSSESELGSQKAHSESQHGEKEFTIIKQPPSSRLGELWDQPLRFTLTVLAIFSILPFILFIIIGFTQDSLWLHGAANGIFEDPIFLSYFLVISLAVISIRYALERQYKTINSLYENGVLRFEQDTSHLTENYSEYKSTLTEDEFREMVDFYQFILARFTFRENVDVSTCPKKHRMKYKYLLRMGIILSVGGIIALSVGTFYHWFAVDTYGFDIWASSNYLVGFVSRFVYELILYVFVIPFVLTQLLLSLLLVYHPLKRLDETNGISFYRFAPDEAGGLQQFGIQSFTNVFALMPFVISIIMYAIYYPTTNLLLAGLGLYTLAVPTIFIGQIWRAHRSMLEMHEVELNIIGEALTENYQLYKDRLIEADSMDEINDDKLVTHGEALEKADVVYQGIQKQPTWPFGRTQIGKLLSVITFLIGIIVSLI